MKKILLACTLSAATFTSAHADNLAANSPHFFVGFGVGFGGDNMGKVLYTDGSTSNMPAGEGGQFQAGLDYRFTDLFSIQGSIGYQFREEAYASNGNALYSRVPIELLGYYHVSKNWRLGGGVRYVGGAKITGSGLLAGFDEEFENTTGGVLEAEYLIGKHAGIKLRFVKETYTLKDYDPYSGWPASYSGDSVGLVTNYYF
jgi:opacity protein-like surface antigen